MCQELYRSLNLCKHSCSCNPENFDLVICDTIFGYKEEEKGHHAPFNMQRPGTLPNTL